MSKKKLIAFDTETTGLRLYDGAEMFSFSTCDSRWDTRVCRLDGSDSKRRNRHTYLVKLLSGKRFIPIMHNSKFDLTASRTYLQRLGVDDPIPEDLLFHDTITQSHILQNDHPSHRLKDLAWELCQFPKDDEKAVKSFASGGNYGNVPEYLMDEYQEGDAQRTMILHQLFYPMIQADPKYREIYSTELQLVRATMHMEERGIMLDVPRCTAMVDKLRRQVDDTLDDIELLCGERINPRSPAQVRRLLYDIAGLPVVKTTAKTGQPSTDKETIFELQANFPKSLELDLLLRFRSWDHGVGMLSGYLELSDSNGVIHPNINTCAAVTGRESCSAPNLQNVQKSEGLLTPYPVPAREVFRPRPGYVNIHIDYAGIEMRLLVAVSEERELINIIRDGGDVHEPAAITFFKDRFINAKGADRKALRAAAKNANFGIPYGAGFANVASTLGLDVTTGYKRFMEYQGRFPKLCGLTSTIIKVVKEDGYVTTSFGRRLRVSRDKPYMGTNYIIQGTAAGILKRAQNRVDDFLARTTNREVCILLPIHDEIVLECPRGMVQELPYLLREIRLLMIDFPQISVPLEIEASVATRDWAHKREVTIEKQE